MPGEVADEKGRGDGKPGPEGGRYGVEHDMQAVCNRGREEGGDGPSELAERQEADEEACDGEDGQEIAHGEDEGGEICPVETGGDAPYRQGEDIGVADGEYPHQDVKEKTLDTKYDCFQHGSRCSTD